MTTQHLFRYVFDIHQNVVAPISRTSPRDNAGFNTFAASIEPSAEPAPTNRCNSSIKQNNFLMFFGDRQNFLQSLLKLPAIFRPSNHRRQIQLKKSLALQKFGNFIISNSLRQTLNDRSFTDRQVRQLALDYSCYADPKS